MRIRCPYCGERESAEFAYLGDAGITRPDATGPHAAAEFFTAVYLRNNPAGTHQELWYHAYGCRAWLRVTRDTCTHEINAVELAKQDIHA